MGSRRIGLFLGALACAVLASAVPAEAPAQGKKAKARAELRADLGQRAAINWTRGILSAVGVAAGDVRAPSPAIARVGAERQAREAARARLAELVRDLPLAAGGTVGEAIDRDEAAAARLSAALERSIDLDVDYSSDGSVVLMSGLPTEAIRIALAGAPRPPEGEDKEAPTALIVDARALPTRPAIGAELVAGEERWAAPIVYHRGPEQAQADPRVGERALRVKAAAAEGGVIRIPEEAPLAAARRAGALVVVLVKRL